MNQNISSHLDALQLASFLEGRLQPRQQVRVMNHLKTCNRCARELAEMRRLLAMADELPPLRLEHPVERFLAPLQRLAPLPAWGWHCILMTLIFIGWFIFIDASQVTWLRNPFYMGLSFISLIIVTAYFLKIQDEFRALHEGLWEEGVPIQEIDSFQNRYLAPIHGFFPEASNKRFVVEGGWIFIFFSLMIILIDAFRFLPLPGTAWDYWGAVLIGFYNVVNRTGVEWAWLFGSRYFVALARLLQTHRERLSSETLTQARMLGFKWVAVSNISMLWYLIAALITGQAHEPGVLALFSFVALLLLLLSGGYIYLESRLFFHSPNLSQRLAASARMAISGALIISMFGMLLPQII